MTPARRQAGCLLCQSPLQRRSWYYTVQQIRTSLLARATAALLWPIRRWIGLPSNAAAFWTWRPRA